MKLKPNNSQGFTLLEGILVASIIGIAAAIAMPNFFSLRQREHLNNASKVTVGWLDDLRRKAIQKSVPCRATWDTSAGILSGQCDNEESISSRLNINDGIADGVDQISVTIEEGPSIWVFTPRGTSTTQGAVRFSLPDNNDHGRCLKLTAPLALIRAAKQTSTGECDYTTGF